MKKLSILALAAILVIFFTVPASALENEFGGYWRTRFFSQKYFSGFDRGDDIDSDGTEARDDTTERVDTRTQLFYTAKINDNLKLVNKFEFDATWGKDGTYGAPGADTKDIEIKNTYADFNLGPVNFTVGTQNYSLFRDFLISADASGIIARWKAMDNFVLAGSWLKNFENDDSTDGSGENEDLDVYTLTGAFWFNENISIKPSVSVSYASEGSSRNIVDGNLEDVPFNVLPTLLPDSDYGELYLVSYGFDFDMTFDKWGLWVTAFGQTGELEDALLVNPEDTTDVNEDDLDLEGYLFAIGGNVGFGEVGFLGDFGLHGEFLYASGDDSDAEDADDDEFEAVVNPLGSYYWSEIMGKGIFDNRQSAGSPGDIITNLMAFNIGVDMKPMDKLKIAVDLWYAELVESEMNLADEDELGTELNLKITYELVEGLNLDLVGAYLWADDATVGDFSERGPDDANLRATEDNEEDPYEFGARLSLSF